MSISLTKLVKNSHYKHQVSKMLQVYSLYDMVNVEDDHLELIFGPAIDGQ